MKSNLLTACLISALGGLVQADGMYTKNSPVIQITGNDYTSLVEQSNHTSIVEFYAPWCGHCQNLKPAYEKAAKNLAGLAKVVAVNCDDESNKPLCQRMGVQGFPTLKIVRPGTKKGRPAVEDYQGGRTTKAIVDAVINKIPNHVQKVQDSELETWLTSGRMAKAILFTEKGTTAPLVKALAIDFLGSIDFATIRSKEKSAVQKYGVSKFPTIVLVPNSEAEPVTYDGEMKKDSLVKFFSQVASPNPDPAPKKAKASKAKKTKDTSNSASASASAQYSKASQAHKAADFDEHMQAQTIILGDDGPIVSPLPIVEQDQKPAVVKEAASAIPHLITAAELESACLAVKSGNCILIFLPTMEGDNIVPPLAAEALASFAEVAEKHHRRKTNIFPFYGIPAANEAASSIRQELGLKPTPELDIIAINMKRKWWRQYSAKGYDVADAETFVDAIRLGEGTKQKLPADFYSSKKAAGEDSILLAVEPEPVSEEHETKDSHDEL